MNAVCQWGIHPRHSPSLCIHHCSVTQYVMDVVQLKVKGVII